LPQRRLTAMHSSLCRRHHSALAQRWRRYDLDTRRDGRHAIDTRHDALAPCAASCAHYSLRR
jgi:hypothetical protein